MDRSSFITGLNGLHLTEAEAALLRNCRPLGIILFARNCATAEQIVRLVQDAHEAVGSEDLFVLIDQEGGRVQRLRPPLGRALPPAAAYADRYTCGDEKGACAAAFQASCLVASDLKALGINTNCVPVLDVPVPGAHDIIGDRAYGRSVEQVIRLGRAVAEGHLAQGVLPVMKHIPGHGRATEDSHLALPVVSAAQEDLEASDFRPFTALADLPMAMTAHVVYTALDAREPASTSPVVVGQVIRTQIGFDGLLMSDDLGMNALSGSVRSRAEAVIKAGCDVALHCSGVLEEMEAVAAGVPAVSGLAARRAAAAFGLLARQDPFDREAAQAHLAAVIARHTPRSESV